MNFNDFILNKITNSSEEINAGVLVIDIYNYSIDAKTFVCAEKK